MTHIIKYPFLQDYKKLARVYRRMANVLASRDTSDSTIDARSSLQNMAEEYERKSKIFGKRGTKFIFMK